MTKYVAKTIASKLQIPTYTIKINRTISTQVREIKITISIKISLSKGKYLVKSAAFPQLCHTFISGRCKNWLSFTFLKKTPSHMKKI